MRKVVVKSLTHYNGSGVITWVEVHVTTTGGGTVLGAQATVQFTPSLERTGTAPRGGRGSRGRNRPITASGETRPYKHWTLNELAVLKEAALKAAKAHEKWPKDHGSPRRAKITRIEMNQITINLE